MESAIRTLQKVKNKHKIHLICFTALLLYFILITQYQDMAADIICLALILIHAIYQMYMLQVCRILIDIAKEKDYSPSELEYLQFAYYKGITTLDHDLRYCWKGTTTLKQMFTYYTKTSHLVQEYAGNKLHKQILRFCLYRLTKEDVISCVRIVRHHLSHLPSYQKPE